jgi:hypothetical protein
MDWESMGENFKKAPGNSQGDERRCPPVPRQITMSDGRCTLCRAQEQGQALPALSAIPRIHLNNLTRFHVGQVEKKEVVVSFGVSPPPPRRAGIPG